MYELIDNSRLEEKILDICLPKEIVYKEDLGDNELAPLRLGILNKGMDSESEEIIEESEEKTNESGYYPHRKVINTRNGQIWFNPCVKMYFRAFTNEDCVLTIDIFDNDMKNLIKKFVIKSSNNHYSLADMKTIVDDIKSLLTSDETQNKVTSLIEHIRYNIDDLIFEETAQ